VPQVFDFVIEIDNQAFRFVRWSVQVCSCDFIKIL